MIAAFPVIVKSLDKRIKSLALVLMIIAFLGLWALYFIGPFIQAVTENLEPKGLMYAYLGLISVGVLAIMLMTIRKKKSGTLKIYEAGVEIATDTGPVKADFKDLKRISFVVSLFSFYKPYRIEFVYPDFQVLRLQLNTKLDFYAIMDHLYEVTPEELPKEFYNTESND